MHLEKKIRKKRKNRKEESYTIRDRVDERVRELIENPDELEKLEQEIGKNMFYILMKLADFEEKHRAKADIKRQSFHVLERNRQLLANWRTQKIKKLEQEVIELQIYLQDF